MQAYSDSEYDENEFTNTTAKDLFKKMKTKTYGNDDEPQEYDDILGALFEKVPPGEGDEFAAVKPWLGAIKEPKNHPKPNKAAPAETLVIDWVYGYRSEEARQNCFFNTAGQAVYPTAALGVIFDFKAQKQVYFGGGKTEFDGRKQSNDTMDGHNDDVTALCVSYSRKLVATGQNGQKPLICVWDSTTGALVAKKRLPKGSRLVTAIGISANDKYVVATDAAEKVSAFVFDIAGGVNPVADISVNYVVTNVNCHPTDEKVFATCGQRHVMLCTFDGKDKITRQQGKGDIPNMCSVAFSSQNGVLYAGGSDG